ncbi:MAG: hypothetical protein A2735_01920 [Candidatus Yanofskybacteria bacterium RIFCSPHIGHO2_01_FULL_41_21]|uniref:Uncharacterized protein n=1 Tax=Candidatus Yanofskybacteria bacterium RIFCSPHIGHO2_01_FULL_41_21 TaxID=1802660 RepID=A0A1F8EAV3_9BACT|nr:MAG: hypothetical protein A2735_01920 [Candidatus Yanofskybacteria bacterium RIFCSPHIGHO2_01_FULL_41_21]
MKKAKIFIYHFIVFVLGSLSIIVYVFYHLASPSSKAGLGGVIVMPVVALIYVTIFGILCIISLIIWILVAYFRGRRTKKLI